MTTFRNIFARIWAVWGMTSFIATFLVFFIPSLLCWLLPDPAGQRLFVIISRIWMNIWLLLVGCPVSVRGREHFKKGRTYVVTCNHNSLMDIPLSSPFIPGANKTIAKSSFAKVPLFGLYYTKGAILVDRKSGASRKGSFDKMRNVLAKGIHMCVYPEGTRNRTADPLKKFHDGAFRLAITTNTPIIPAVIFNTKKALPLDKTFYFLPQRLHMHFLPEIAVEGLTTEELREKVFAVMHEYYQATSQKI
jgi:1-acyl-sn-glycerol-3-phosphate acyltransferase